MCRRSKGRIVPLSSLILFCALFGAGTARAQTDEDRAGARTLATEGAKAFAAQRWSDAVDLFTRAEALVHAPPHLLFLARARTKLGQLVLARETYTKIVRENIAPGAPAAFVEAQAAARAELPGLEPRIAMLTVTVSGADAKAVSIMVDGQKLASVYVGAPKPIDPGEHKIQATSDGMVSDVVTLHIKEGARQSVSLALAPQKGAPSVALPTQVTAPPAQATPPALVTPSPNQMDAATRDTASAPAESGTSALRIASYVALGVGAVGLGAGTVFGLQSVSKRSSADELCPDPNHCLNSKKDTVEELDNAARQAQTLATVGFVAGGVGVAAGVTLLLLSGKKDQSALRQHPTIRPWIGFQAAGVSGTF
jgi:hypothetical protein